MRYAICSFLTLALSGQAWGLPELSAMMGGEPCGGCHQSVLRFERNLYSDIRLPDGSSLVDKDGVARIPWQAGETMELVIVTGLKKQDLDARAAGWYLNLPAGTMVWPGDLHYGTRRINFELPGAFTGDGLHYRVWSRLRITFGMGPPPEKTELWVGAGARAVDKYPGSQERKRTLGLGKVTVLWTASGPR